MMQNVTPKEGARAKFFHPRTLGVMHWGTVTKVHGNGDVTVKFEVDKRSWRTLPDNNGQA